MTLLSQRNGEIKIMVRKYYLPLAALSVLGLTNIVTAASRNTANDGPSSSMQRNDGNRRDGRQSGRYDRAQCQPYQGKDEVRCVQECPPVQPPAPCYPDDCYTCPRCLGPENFAGNPPVCPRTCDGDWDFIIAGFYWNAHQDGMEYAIVTDVVNPNATAGTGDPTLAQIQVLNTLIDAEYEMPKFKWDFGFKLGVAYCSPCDGWDIGLLWTRYHGRASEDIDADSEDNNTILPLWSAFVPT